MDTNNRIARNTLLLYFRMLLTVAVSLYTVRLVLETLGELDYGVYNVVGGVVTMFAFLSGTMASASQRFFAFELGQKNYDQLKRIFSITMLIYIMIGILVLILSETVGMWFVNTQLTIPADRMHAARWVYRFSVFSFMMTMIAVPYNAVIVAHERMKLYAYVSVVEVLLKLLTVYLLLISSFDSLKLYAVLTFGVTTIVTFTYWIYCRRNFDESKFSFYWEGTLLKSIVSYSSWNLIGNLGVVLKEQGTNILLNIFFSPVVNAARGIAFQVSSVLNSFVTNFQMAINPQIVKSYSSGDFKFYILLINRGARYSYYLLLLLSLPMLFGTDFILGIWLKDTPAHTVSFVRLIVITSLIDSLYRTVLSGHLATGKIKLLQIVVGGINLLLIPICYLLLKLGYQPESVFAVGVCFSIVGLWLRLILFKKVFIQFSIVEYASDVIVNVLKVTLLSTIIPFSLVFISRVDSMPSFFLLGFSTIVCTILTIYFIGLDTEEKIYVVSKVRQSIKKIKR